jgi:uncharacterized phage protein (TIGR02216 family)
MIQRFGFGFLRLSPNAFWAMTPREIFHALSFHQPVPAQIERSRFDAMTRRFPDTQG